MTVHKMVGQSRLHSAVLAHQPIICVPVATVVLQPQQVSSGLVLLAMWLGTHSKLSSNLPPNTQSTQHMLYKSCDIHVQVDSCCTSQMCYTQVITYRFM